MRIHEVEALIGISKKNIRFYEQEKLLAPSRSEGNRYRDYGPGDIRRLKQIKLLRKLDMPIPEIRELLEGTLSLPVAVRRHMVRLDGQMDDLAQARQLCALIADDSIGLSSLDPDHYLEQVTRLEQQGSAFPNTARDEVRRYAGPLAACICFILVLVLVLGAALWQTVADSAPWPVIALLALLIPILIILPLWALVSRIREIRKGEENDLGQY